MAAPSEPVSPSPRFESTHDLTRAIIILLIIEAAASIAIAVFQVAGDLSPNIIFYTDPWILGALEAVSSLVAFANLIISLLWFYRNHRNLPALGASELRFTPGWAVVWWFIPVLNLWKPYQVTVEIMKSSDPAVGRTDSEARKAMKRPPYVLAWWLFNFVAVVMLIVAYVLATLEAGVDTGMPSPGWLAAVESIVTLIAVWLTIKVVKEIDARQAKKIELIRSGHYGSA